jgi:hypothetical protein
MSGKTGKGKKVPLNGKIIIGFVAGNRWAAFSFGI